MKFLRGALALVAMAAMVASAGAQQASITLNNCDADFCYSHNNVWTLTKNVTGNTVTDGVGTVTWTVTATKDSSAAPTFTVHGGLTIFNSGSAPATIGNIVVNLQKPNSPKKGSNASHVSIAANIANATSGDAATSAMIVSGASQENANTNAAWGVNNYTTASGGKGTFVETAGSGTLNFTDAMNNTVFSMVPQPVIPVGDSITLLYEATFQTAVLPPPGTSMRVETIVTFGNAGARGGSGSTANNIDVDGSGSLSSDEAKVRSVPCRVTLAKLPALPEECNDTVTVDDVAATTVGSVTTSNAVGFEQFPAVISGTQSWDVSVDVDGGDEGGTVCNGATLDGVGDSFPLEVVVGYELGIIGYDPLTNEPIYGDVPVFATYTCCEAASETASDCLFVAATPDDVPELKSGDFCSWSQGGFGGSGVPYNTLAANFAAVFPSGVEVGIPGTGGFSMKFTSASAIQTYLPAGGGSNKLTADLLNPTSSVAGNFGGQVLALKLNMALSDAGVTTAGFDDLYYCNPGSSLHGQTVGQILAAAETAIGGGALPAGYTYTTLAGLCADLNLSFDGKSAEFPNCGLMSDWAAAHLSKVPCSP